jgi:hypothetical protein
LTKRFGEVVAVDRLGENLLKARAPPSFRAELGSRLWITIPAEKLHLFDKKTGKACW